MQSIPLLEKGDRVALIATARKVTPDEVETAVGLLESWGLKVEVPEGLFSAEGQLAGSDEHRAALVQRLLDDEMVKALFCSRGGYGTVRIIDRLSFDRFRRHPKWIVGYSDATVLHSHVARRVGLPTLHATMPINITSDTLTSPAVESLRQWLFEGRLRYQFETPALPHAVGNRSGTATAPIVGGNLSILYSLLGSASDLDTSGKILLLEDLDEYLYHVDRMMMALRRAGKLEGLKGLLVGALSDMHDNSVPFGRDAEAIVRDAVAAYDYPVAFYAPFGHIGGQNLAIPLGTTATIDIHEYQATITI